MEDLESQVSLPVCEYGVMGHISLEGGAQSLYLEPQADMRL